MTAGLRVVAHGGGKQTTAVLVLAATGRLDYKTFLFANVGDDSAALPAGDRHAVRAGARHHDP
jgi:hypothetical protein